MKIVHWTSHCKQQTLTPAMHEEEHTAGRAESLTTCVTADHNQQVHVQNCF